MPLNRQRDSYGHAIQQALWQCGANDYSEV